MRRIGEFWLRYGYAMKFACGAAGRLQVHGAFHVLEDGGDEHLPVYDAGDVPSDDQGIFEKESLWRLGPDDDRPHRLGEQQAA